MATLRTSAAGGDTTGTSDRTCTIVPAVGDLFVVFHSNSVNTNIVPTCSDDNGGTYTRIRNALFNSSGSSSGVFVRDQLLTNTTSTVVTVATGANDSGNVVVLAVAGMSKFGSAAVLQSARQNNQAAGTTPAPVFPSTTLTANFVCGAVANGSNPAGMTPPVPLPERQDVGQATPNIGLEAVSINSGVALTTVTWGGTSATAFAAFVVELDASDEGSASITLGAATLSAVGDVAVSGTASITLGALTSSAAGNVAVAGTLSKTLGAAALAGTGTVAAAGATSIVCIITSPMDGTDGDSGTEDPHHLAGYTIEQFSSDSSTVGGGDTKIVHTAWSADDGWTDTGRHVQHRFDTAGDHVVTCTITGDAGGTDTTTKTITTITPTFAFDKYVKAASAGGSDSASGADDANAYATIEKAFQKWRDLGSDASRKGVYGIIRIKDTAPPAFTGLADGTHDPSPDHGFLVITRYGTSVVPEVLCNDNTNITCQANNHVPLEWGWSVYIKDVKFTWAGRNENNEIFLGNMGSQLDGVTITNGWTDLSQSIKKAFVNGSVTLSGKDGIFASCPWLILDTVSVTLNCFLGVNAEHQVYGSNGLHHFAFRRMTVIGDDQGNDGLRLVSAVKGYIADCTVTDIFNSGDALFPGANNSGDDAGSLHILERCVVNAANKGVNANGADDVLVRNVIVKATNGSGAVTFGGHNTGPSSVNGRIYHSVVYASVNADLTTDQYSTTSQSKNNIFQKTGGTAVFYDIDTLANFTSDYNCFWRVGGTPDADANFANVAGVLKTWAQWQALGQDAHSIFRDPLFTDAPGGDFTLQGGSPCIAAGTHLGEVPFDFIGTARPTPPSMGAYEAVAGDTLAPTVEVTAPANGVEVAGTVLVTASASDAVGVVGVQFKRSGVNLGAEVTTPPYTVSWDTTQVPDGAYSLTAVARDAAGNSAESAPITVFVVNTPEEPPPDPDNPPPPTRPRGPLFTVGTGPFRPWITTHRRLFPTLPHRRK